MRKVLVLVGIVAALAIPATALSVDLHSAHVGTTCADGGMFHFVAVGGGGAGQLSVSFSGGGGGTVQPEDSPSANSHYWVEGFGTLLSASATEGRKLVLSSYTCYEKKD